MQEITITKEEQKAIASLNRLAKKWPKSLSLFSFSASLCVTKAVDGQNYQICYIEGIPNDGGDPTDEELVQSSYVNIEYEY